MFLLRAVEEGVGVCAECGLPMDELRQECPVSVGPAPRRDLRALYEAKRAAEERAEDLRVLCRDAVGAEYLAGRTLRDIAAEVGVSHQRIHELTAPVRARLR